MTNWYERFLNLAHHVAQWSKDRSTKVGAVIANQDKRVLSLGYNGFPAGATDDAIDRHERPLKYKWTEHAERNAIFSAARTGMNINGATIYTTYFPCADCARAIVQAGILELVTIKPDDNDARWGEEFRISKQILAEGNVNILEFNRYDVLPDERTDVELYHEYCEERRRKEAKNGQTT